MGRTARGRDGKGRALLMLLPEELAFLKYLKAAKVPLNEYDFPANKIANVQVGVLAWAGMAWGLGLGWRFASTCNIT